MTTKRFDQLPAVSALTGTELVPVMQGGYTRRTTVAALNPTAGWPARLLIFYGIPEGVNGLYDVEYAVNVFALYDFVVLGTGLQDPANVYNTSTTSIIARCPRTAFFGYLDVSTAYGNLSMIAMKQVVDAWLVMGVRGIFMDVAGYEFGVTRARLNEIVAYVHGLGLAVCANSGNPDELFGNAVDATYNPTGAPTSLGPADYYLAESWVMNTVAYAAGGWDIVFTWKAKAEKILAYRNALGFKVWSSAIVDHSVYTTEEVALRWSVFEALSLAYGWDGYAMAAPDYAATGATLNDVRIFPYRSVRIRPPGAPHFDAPWETITSPATGQQVTYGAGATPVYSVAEYAGA